MEERPVYVRVKEYTLDEGQRQAEVSIRSIADDGVVNSTVVEREIFRTERGYKKAIRKETESALRFMGSIPMHEAISL
ncbi:MAG: hypothetical protein WD877_02240 [Candidatus Saccharimonadales bacterium]